MKRTQVCLADRQKVLLDGLSAELQRSQSELIREAMELLFARYLAASRPTPAATVWLEPGVRQ